MSLPAKILLGIALAFPQWSQASLPTRIDSEHTHNVRVLLGHFSRLTLSGIDLVINGHTQLAGEAVFNVRCKQNSQGQAVIEYGLAQSQSDRLEIYAPGGFLHLNQKLYRNRITIFSRGNQCSVTNTLGMEKYLAGLINREMAPSWPLEAMKAQAVASRSYAISQSQLNRNKEYDLESTTQDQVYDGAASESAKSNQAAEETRGLVLAFANSPLKAYFHANCGGKTELPVAVWGNETRAFKTVFCPYHQRARDKIRWNLQLSNTQIQRALVKIAGLLPRDFKKLAKLEAGAPTSNERLNDVVVSDVTGHSIVISANTFRQAIGNTKIRSTAFQVRQNGGKVEIEGEGFGHGVGMCQVGARAMAEAGKSFRQILQHYYPLAQLQRR